MTPQSRIAAAVCLALALSPGLSACEDSSLDPHNCEPGDVDGDGDGRCNE